MTTNLSQFLARGIYYLHAILIFVLIFGWIIPNSPTLWIAFVSIIIASAVMYVLTGGCALNRRVNRLPLGEGAALRVALANSGNVALPSE